MGLLFGPGLTIVTVLLMFRGESRVASGLTATFSLVTWYALYTSLFQRRRIVFDPATGTVKLFRGRASCGTLSRSDIVSLDLKPVERTVPGVSLQNPFRWTNYLISARLQGDGDVPFLESPVERTITELYRKIQREFIRVS